MMSFHDAQLTYDGRIPAGVVDPAAPDAFRAANAVRIGKVTPKPDAVRARLVKAMTLLAGAGAITEHDLARLGFTAAEIRDHAADALRQVMIENPTFSTIEWAA